MSDIFIVGSAGFIGSNVTNYMIQHTKYQVASMDDMRDTEDLRNLQPSIHAKSRHTFYVADFMDYHITKTIMRLEKPKVLIFNQWDEDRLVSGMMCQVRAMIKAAMEHGLEKVIVLMPTVTKYNDHWLADVETRFHYEQKNLPVYVLKPCNVFGPRQDAWETIPRLISACIDDTEMIVAEHSPEWQEWIYVKDYYQQIIRVIEEDHEPGSYALHSGQFASEKDVYLFLRGKINNEESFVWPWTAGRRDPLLEGKEWEWRPSNPLTAALEHTAVWYHQNEWARG